jgi:hypothetical protein
MATIDFRIFEGERVVVHFGGIDASIDAYTFGNSLVAFTDAVLAINKVINPGQEIEIQLEAQGPGSFRAVVRRVAKDIGGFFSRGVEPVFWGVVGTLIYEQAIRPSIEPKTEIVINTTEVIYQSGSDRVIVPRAVYDAMPNVRKDPEVRRNVARTFKVLEADKAIDNFGLTGRIDDPTPTLQIPRQKFSALADATMIVDETARTRTREEKARLVILKAWLNHAKRKWSFEWNGVPISAPIADEDFLAKLDNRDYLIGAGDALDVIIDFRQNFDEELKVYVNDQNSFVVVKVLNPVPRKKQPQLPDKKPKK